ncbi:hypothetical protein [Arthrobacter sp. Alg241-R88]|uniref:hypothetical protein n=1 Tax=Arthrobacter sp. Alg241-R88 TaxID=2305984 RepID=UPI0013D644FF|nr:hypothetical protein [Arthrobacter sp. Alg241-R88]
MTSIPLPFELPPLTKNQVRRLHHHKEAKIRRQSMEATRWAIRAAKVQPLEQAVVILHWRVPNRHRRDGDGAQPTLSFCLDALVLEGVLPDDSWKFVAHSGVTVHPPIPGQPGALWLSINDPTDLKESA